MPLLHRNVVFNEHHQTLYKFCLAKFHDVITIYLCAAAVLKVQSCKAYVILNKIKC
jgi:hypothetical protein